jgi:hypothetical protein
MLPEKSLAKDERALWPRQQPSAIRVSSDPFARELETRLFFVRNLPVS